MKTTASQRQRIFDAVKPQRLLDMARKLVAVPSKTGEARAVLDCLADMLAAEGFTVERPDGGYPQAPAVAVRYKGRRPGRTLHTTGISTPCICRSCRRAWMATCCVAAAHRT